ncbi:uncharacterized [Tachysurus ichikawai]
MFCALIRGVSDDLTDTRPSRLITRPSDRRRGTSASVRVRVAVVVDFLRWRLDVRQRTAVTSLRRTDL